jgi:hypothetical protein
MNEDQLHELARMFMYQFPLLEQLSLDEFYREHANALSAEQLNLRIYILELFDE